MLSPVASLAQKLRQQTVDREAQRLGKMLAWLTPELALSVVAKLAEMQRDRLRKKYSKRSGGLADAVSRVDL